MRIIKEQAKSHKHTSAIFSIFLFIHFILLMELSYSRIVKKYWIFHIKLT